MKINLKHSLAWGALGALLSALYLGRALPGADFSAFLAWAQALLRGDLLLSPQGQLVVRQASGQVGLIWAPAWGLSQHLLQVSGGLLGNGLYWLASQNLFTGLAVVVLLAWALRRAGAGPLPLAAGAALAFVGTSLLPCTLLEVSGEAPSCLAGLGMALYAWAGDSRQRAWCALLGLLAGLAGALSLANLCVGLPVLALAAWEQARQERFGEALRRVFILGLATGLGFCPVFFYNLALTGSPLLFPLGSTLPGGQSPVFTPWPASLGGLLWSPSHGLLPLQPLFLLGLAGAGLFLVRDINGLGPGRLKAWLARPARENLPYALLLGFLALLWAWGSLRPGLAGPWALDGRLFIIYAPWAGLALAYLLHTWRARRLTHPGVILAVAACLPFILLYATGNSLRAVTTYAQFGALLGRSLGAFWEGAPWLLPLWAGLWAADLLPGSPERRERRAGWLLAAWALSTALAPALFHPYLRQTGPLEYALLAAAVGCAVAGLAWRLARGGALSRWTRLGVLAAALALALWPAGAALRTVEMVAQDPTLDARWRWTDPRTGRQAIVTFDLEAIDPGEPFYKEFKAQCQRPPWN